jgi:Mu-like prophage major head subunit gpT
MAAINRAALAEHLWPGIIEFFGMEYSDYEDQYGYVFTTRGSTKAYEEYVMESGFGLAPVKEAGAPVSFDEAADTWKGRVEMVAYALGFVITREAVEDDQYFDLVPRYTRALKRSMKQTKEVRAAAFVDGVFTTSQTGDGVSVVNTAHPLKNGNTFSNRAAANADLNETSLEAAIIQIADYVDERGLRISVQPKSMVVPNGLQFTAERLMKTTVGRVGTGDNDVAALHTMGMIPEGYKINNYLSDPRAWFLTTNVAEGMTHWARTPLDIEQGDGSETQTLKALAYERYAFSCMDPRSFWGAPGQ